MAERIETFIGFCVKTRRITLGAGAVDCLRDKVYLLILSADAAKNTKKSAIKFKNRFSCPLLICKSDFDRVVNKPGCKIAAIRDKGLSEAILGSLNSNYELYAGGNV